ncbi:MAG: cytochrome bc complex cytochrome b subunit, partial [Nitrospirales bacterium]
FFPRQVFIDLAFFGIVFVSICGLAVTWPHELLDEASPEASDLDPEPEWYFLFLFQLLRDPALSFLFYGEFGEFLGAIVVPGLFLLLLVALPFLDRNPERNLRKRPLAVSAWALIMISIIVLTIRAIQFRE